MTNLKCFKCGRSIWDGAALFRQNGYDEDPFWACEVCNEKPIDSEVKEIVGIIQEDNKRTNHE